MSLSDAVDAYVKDLERRGRRPHTVRGYRSDLSLLLDCAAELSGDELDDVVLTEFVARLQRRAPATRARGRSALRGFLRWMDREELAVRVSERQDASDAASQSPGNRSATRTDVEAALAAIPRLADRDRLLFGLIARLGLRPGEALALQIEDLDEPTETLQVPGWGGVRRRVLVDDPQILIGLINRIRVSGRTSGPLFTAPGRTTPLRYQSVLQRWNRYTDAAGVSVRLSDLRRLHAEELLAGGVPEAVVRERLGQRTRSLSGRPASASEGDDAIRAWRSARVAGTTRHEHHSQRSA